MPPLFDFQLTALDRVVPWGKSDDLNLHWFGLSDGSYWMNVGETKLFEYSEGAQAQGAPQFCDYQVVRLHEDVIEISPKVLEVVPQELRAFIEFKVDRPLGGYWRAWRELSEAIVTADEHLDLLDIGATWLGQRTLDSLYLSPASNIWLWSDSENVHIHWDNRSRKFKGQLAWSATAGTHSLPRDTFIKEVLSFHERLMCAMDKRIHQVIAGALPKSIRIDIDGLVREQRERVASVNRSALMRCPETNWTHAALAIAKLEELRGESQVNHHIRR
jgi:hypothetical protein